MYKKILVALENGPADEGLLSHVAKLAEELKSELLLLHVADGFAARNFDQLKLAESEEMKNDRLYLEKEAAKIRPRGVKVQTLLGLGDPAKEILKTAQDNQCDLIAMGGHGHRFIEDIFYGSPTHSVRHHSLIPVLIVRMPRK